VEFLWYNVIAATVVIAVATLVSEVSAGKKGGIRIPPQVE
jgi:hypothetical protein